jgi:hypothetical protein
MTALVILGLGQSLVPSLLRTACSTLTIAHRHSAPGPDDGRDGFLISQETSVESRQESETDAETTDTCEILECLGWPEGIADRRSAPLGDGSSWSEALPRDQGRTAALQRRSWTLSVLTSTPDSLPTKLCRFLC